MKRHISIKLFGFILLSCCLLLPLSAQESILKEAEAAYSAEEFNRAAELYESVIEQYGESSVVYYNLGNAYYKAGKVGASILNFERALLLDPGDSDIRFNLQMARGRAVDQIESIDDFILVKWFKSIQDMGAADSWAKLGILFFLLFIGCLVMYFFGRWIRVKKVGFYFAFLFLFLVILTNVFARNQKNELLNRTHAIVFVPTVTVKSSPSGSGTDLFILHEGTKVSIKSSLGDWNEIELENGNIGWMQKKEMVVI